MQDLASEFSKIFRGDTPGPSQWEGATPSHTQHPAWPLAGRGRGESAPVFGLKPWSRLTFQPWLRPWFVRDSTYSNSTVLCSSFAGRADELQVQFSKRHVQGLELCPKGHARTKTKDDTPP